jgi:outer membrane protein assembly factor BamB
MEEPVMRTRAIWTLSLLLILLLTGCGNAGTGGTTNGNLPGGQPTASQPVLYLVDNFIASSGLPVDQVEAFKNGKALWKYPLPALLGGEYPILVTSHVVYIGRGDTLYALQADTGKLMWKVPAAPAITKIVIDAGTVYVDSGGGFAGQESLYAFSVRDQSLLWRYTLSGAGGILGWTVADNTFYAVIGGLPSELLPLDTTTGQQRWQAPLNTIDGFFSALIPAGANQLLLQTNTVLIMVQDSDGRELWRLETGAREVQIFNSILYSFFVDEPPPASSEQTKVGIRALQASDGNKLWETPVPSDIAPALETRMNLAIGTITPEGSYLLDGPNLADLSVWSTQDGKALWQHQSSDGYTAIFADENAVFTASAHGLFAWKATDGVSLWQQTSPSDIGALLFPSFQKMGGILYGISQNNNNIYAFNPQNGKQLWMVHVNVIHNLFIA